MRYEVVDGVTRVYFRQSWANTYLMCQERARRDLFTEDDDTSNEFACIGTALHAGIEASLNDQATSPFQVAEIAVAKLTELEQTFEYADTSRAQAIQYLYGWARQLRSTPEFTDLRDKPRMVEQSFAVRVAVRGNVEQWWEGTVDAVRPSIRVIDWKTSSRQYQRWERQRWAIQPTFYTEAGRQLGWLPVDEPSEFVYVVFDRSARPKPPQRVLVTRGPEHTAWTAHQLWAAYDQSTEVGVDVEWPTNDQHALCSEKWCAHWDTCKGAYIAPDFNPREE